MLMTAMKAAVTKTMVMLAVMSDGRGGRDERRSCSMRARGLAELRYIRRADFYDKARTLHPLPPHRPAKNCPLPVPARVPEPRAGGGGAAAHLTSARVGDTAGGR